MTSPRVATILRAAPATFAGEPCYHGGAFFEAIGADLRTISKRHEIINADVLDAWFAPTPRAIAALFSDLDWLMRTSPPTQCEGLIEKIAEARGLPSRNVVVGAGSSDLVFRALPLWLTNRSRVMLLDPTYGEYDHLLKHVIGCEVDRFHLQFSDEYRIDAGKLTERIRRTRPDFVILVNPNNPTGRHLRRSDLELVIANSPASTCVWIDEAYLDYIGAEESLEQVAVNAANVVVCKSLSKVYALSGMRAAYLTTSTSLAREVRRLTPPWAVGLPAQLAAIEALGDPEYYRERYAETHRLRATLAGDLRDVGFEVLEGRANSMLCRLSGPWAARVVDGARDRGLFIRDIATTSTRPTHDIIRVAVKDEATNARMVDILATLL